MSKKKNSLPAPAGFRILLKPRELQEKTAGGIILVDEPLQRAFTYKALNKLIQGSACRS